MSGAEPSERSARVAERIRQVLMELLLRGEVRDPIAASLSITHVRISPDLRHARVYLRLLSLDSATGDSPKMAVAALKRAAGFLRRRIGQEVRLKYTPTLEFFWDEQVDEATRMERLLAEVRKDEGWEPQS